MQRFFGPNISLDRHFFDKFLFEIFFSIKNFFWPKHFLTKDIFVEKKSRQKINSDQNLFKENQANHFRPWSCFDNFYHFDHFDYHNYHDHFGHFGLFFPLISLIPLITLDTFITLSPLSILTLCTLNTLNNLKNL